VLDVVEALDGAVGPARCTATETCGAPRDETDLVFEEAARALEEVLEGYSIADLTAGEAGPRKE
jgi:DNA-binding IscR family transcriptional regulator